MKFGAASNPACGKIVGDVLNIHAGWRCASTKHRYINYGLSERLAVSKGTFNLVSMIFVFIIHQIFSLARDWSKRVSKNWGISENIPQF